MFAFLPLPVRTFAHHPRYVRHVLKTGTMEELLSKDDELVHEVKALDSDMQMLV